MGLPFTGLHVDATSHLSEQQLPVVEDVVQDQFSNSIKDSIAVAIAEGRLSVSEVAVVNTLCLSVVGI